VADEQDMLHLQHLDGVFQRGGNPVVMAVGLVRRYQTGHVAYHEQIARRRVGQQAGVDPRVAAADDQGAGFLPLFETVEQGGVFSEIVFLEAAETGDKGVEIIHGGTPGAGRLVWPVLRCTATPAGLAGDCRGNRARRPAI
jgi:hypothetical protein